LLAETLVAEKEITMTEIQEIFAVLAILVIIGQLSFTNQYLKHIKEVLEDIREDISPPTNRERWGLDD
jgi:hypothetical protein